MAKTMTTENVQKKHKSIFTFSNVIYNADLVDDLFSQRRITRGIK